jgi:phosphoglycerate dehydrogenase-like enzyme
MRVLLDYAVSPTWQRELSALTDRGLYVDCCDETDNDRFYSLLPQTEILWHVLRPVSASDLAKARRLRLIQKIGIGVNTIDLTTAQARGILVCNMPGTNTRAVTEMTLLLMLACLRRLPFLDRATRAGTGWRLDSARQDDYGELAGRTVGLVGYGAVSRTLAPILRALSAEVIYTASAPKSDTVDAFRSLPELLHQSDIVSLHLPLTSETAKLIDREKLALMKRNGILINAARGGLVDQAALAEALCEGRIGAAGLDVFAFEPVTPDEKLLKLDNVVLTPHIAWLTSGTLMRSLVVAVENCRRLTDGEELMHRVV